MYSYIYIACKYAYGKVIQHMFECVLRKTKMFEEKKKNKKNKSNNNNNNTKKKEK